MLTYWLGTLRKSGLCSHCNGSKSMRAGGCHSAIILQHKLVKGARGDTSTPITVWWYENSGKRLKEEEAVILVKCCLDIKWHKNGHVTTVSDNTEVINDLNKSRLGRAEKTEAQLERAKGWRASEGVWTGRQTTLFRYCCWQEGVKQWETVERDRGE